jgi:uroporphyrinogen-III synthase
MPESPSHIGILILRPEQQAQGTIDAVTSQGWHAIHFPTIRIDRNTDIDGGQIQSRVSLADWVVFISQNAVSHFLAITDSNTLQQKKVASVGQSTTRLLESHGISVNYQPDRHYSTEGLLASETFKHISGQKIVIIRGIGGREQLADTLRQRGASVDYIEVYKRGLADTDPDQLLPFWPDQISLIIATSNQLLDNLLVLCRARLGKRLFDKPVVVLSERMHTHAQELGFKKIWLAERSSNDEIIKTIIKNMTTN